MKTSYLDMIAKILFFVREYSLVIAWALLTWSICGWSARGWAASAAIAIIVGNLLIMYGAFLEGGDDKSSSDSE